MGIKFKDTIPPEQEYELIETINDSNNKSHFTFRVWNNGRNLGIIKRDLNGVMYFVENKLVKLSPKNKLVEHDTKRICNLKTMTPSQTIIEFEDVACSFTIMPTRDFWEELSKGTYLSISNPEENTPKKTQPTIENKCTHSKKYVNYAGGTGFWFCPDCKQDLGNVVN